MNSPLLEIRSVSKSFPGVRALHNVSLHLNRGEVLAIIGENGAGKSTLMKILAGVQRPDDGQILLEGQPIEIDSVESALRLGVVLIHQELNLAGNLDVAANIFLGREPRRFGFIAKNRIAKQAGAIMRRVGLDCSTDTIVGTLSVGQQQMVEIAKALSVNARVLIMDEPTSSLSQHEAEQLFKVISELRANGISIVYISHRLKEVRQLADRVIVLRDGQNAGELAHDEIEHGRMVRLMVGRDVSQFYQRTPQSPGEIVLEVSKLRTQAHPQHELNFQIRSGEIVGVAGLVGAGRTEMLQSLFGVAPALAGSIRIASREIRIHNPLVAIRAGLALVPEDRKQHGLFLEMAIRENLSLPSLRQMRRGGFMDYGEEKNIARQMIQQLSIKTPGDRQLAQFLSGGNQQKVVLGKWLMMRPKVLLLDEPTRGIDVGAKQEIYRLMEQLAKSGVAILFVSSEMEEIMGMSDRAIVMHEGRISGELQRHQLSDEAIMQLATGRNAGAAA